MPVEDLVQDQPSNVVVGIVGSPYHSATKYPCRMITICQGPAKSPNCLSRMRFSLSGSMPPSERTSSGVFVVRKPPADSGGGVYVSSAKSPDVKTIAKNATSTNSF